MQESHRSGSEETGEPSNADRTADTQNTADDVQAAESSTGAPAPTPKRCASCNKAEEDDEHPLKECAKCHSISYCSRDCQKADFKQHKKNCASMAQIYAQSGSQRPVQAAPRVPKQAHRGGLQKWQFDT